MEKEALVETLLDVGVATTASKREALLDAGVATTEEKSYWCPSEHVGALFGNPGCVCGLPVVESLTNEDLEGLYASLEYGERFEADAIETKEAA